MCIAERFSKDLSSDLLRTFSLHINALGKKCKQEHMHAFVLFVLSGLMCNNNAQRPYKIKVL